METVWTSPGCDAPSHGREVMGAALMWEYEARFPLPSTMECGCSIVWIGDDEPANWR